MRTIIMMDEKELLVTNSSNPVSPIYSIDRFNLLLRMDLKELWELVRSQNLRDYARSVKPKRVKSEERARGYRSQLEVTKFEVEILRILSRSLRRRDYQLNLVEIACDVLSETASRARSKSRTINKVLRKLYTPEVRLYDTHKETDDVLNRRRKPRRETPYDDELLGEETAYTGGKNFEYKVYARKVPATEHPAVRGEWTFQGIETIRERLGVQTIYGLSRLNFQEKFLQFYRRFIRYEEIDHEKHGRFIMKEPYNSPRLIEGPKAVRLSYSKTKTISHVYVRLHDIKNSAQLRHHYSAEKKGIEEKLHSNRPLQPLEVRIRKLSPKRINSFFSAIPDPFLGEEPPHRTE